MNCGMEYGMNVVNKIHEELDCTIKDFTQGHTATQITIQNLTQRFLELRAGMQQQSP